MSDTLAAVRIGLLAFLFAIPESTVGLQAAPPPPSKPQFSSTSNLIEVPLVVQSGDGEPVLDLKREDVTILDNGKEQKLADFKLVQFGSNAPANVGSSTLRDTQPENRYLLIVIPRLGLGSRNHAIRAVQKALRTGQIAASDYVAIVDNSGIAQPFTRDIKRSEATLNAIHNKNVSPCWDGDWLPKAHVLLGKLQQSSGRKFIIMFTESSGSDSCFRAAANSPSLLMSEALAANASIYPADTSGVEVVIPFGDASQGGIAWGPNVGASIMADISNRNSQLAYQSMELDDLAKSSGGRALTGNNDLSAVFALADKDSTYYRLAYYLNDLQSDGSFHAISVKVNRKKTHLLHKPGYFAPVPFSELSRARKRDWLFNALVTERPLKDVQIIAAQNVFPDTTAKFTVHVAVTLEMSWWVARDLPRPSRQWVSLAGLLRQNGLPEAKFARETSWAAEDVQRDGDYLLRKARFNLLLPLAPGNYELGIAAADLDANVIGASWFALQVRLPEATEFFIPPPVIADKLIPSTLSAGKGFHFVKTFDPLLWQDQRVIPSPTTAFSPSATIYFFTRIYDSSNASPSFRSVLTIRNATGLPVIGPLESTITTDPKANGTPLLFTVNLTRFSIPAGMYQAELQVADKGRSCSSAASFAITASN